MSAPLKLVATVAVAAILFHVARLAYIKYAYPSHDTAKAADIEPAGGKKA